MNVSFKCTCWRLRQLTTDVLRPHGSPPPRVGHCQCEHGFTATPASLVHNLCHETKKSPLPPPPRHSALTFGFQCPQLWETDLCPAWWNMPVKADSGSEGRRTLLQDSLCYIVNSRQSWLQSETTVPTEETGWGYSVTVAYNRPRQDLSLWWHNWERKPGVHTGEACSLSDFCLFLSDTRDVTE